MSDIEFKKLIKDIVDNNRTILIYHTDNSIYLDVEYVNYDLVEKLLICLLKFKHYKIYPKSQWSNLDKEKCIFLQRSILFFDNNGIKKVCHYRMSDFFDRQLYLSFKLFNSFDNLICPITQKDINKKFLNFVLKDRLFDMCTIYINSNIKLFKEDDLSSLCQDIRKYIKNNKVIITQ